MAGLNLGADSDFFDADPREPGKDPLNRDADMSWTRQGQDWSIADRDERVAEQQRRLFAADNAYTDPNTGEVRYPSMGWAMQQDPELYDVLNQQKIDQNAEYRGRMAADEWFAPGVSPQTGEPRGLNELEGPEGSIGGNQTDPFQYGESALTNLQNQRAAMYADYFANQEGFAQDKYDSITSYLNELQIGADAQYQKDMADMSAQYDSMQTSRNERFAEAYARGGDRSGLAMDTLASLGITPDATTFDSVTGETDNMLFSQQQSGADMLNTMRFISNQMLDFGKSASSRSISAGLQQSEMALAQEMANIQLAKDSFAISEIEAAIAQEKATAEANAALARASEAEEKMNAYFITAGRVYAPEATDAELVAMGNTGLLDPLVQAAMQPGVPEPTTIPWGATPETGSPMTQEQLQMMATMHAMTNQGQAPQYYQDPVTGLTVPVESASDLLSVMQAQSQS